MSETDSGQPSRRLAAIMFTDLVGYSALAHRDEVLAIELLELHRGWVRETLQGFGGREIETVGDAFLIEFAGALAAVQCALAIQQRFSAHNASAPEDRRMQLRIGIHLGDIEHKDGKVMGDGVNIASRIHAVAPPGGICVSEDVHHAMRNRADFCFVSLGRPELKNIAARVEVFAVAARTQAAGTRAARAWPRIPRWLPIGAAAAIVAALGGTWYATRPQPVQGPPSVAVLPFDNLSAEPDSAYFTDGLHDTVIGHLSRVSGLKVISRTSVMGYRDQKPRPKLRDIAHELGVGHIVEGSVQRAGGRLRVAAQLIDTATDAHLWSNEYDRELEDVFAVQADIAKSVAAAVHARLSPQERASIDLVPTKNQAAYDLYLRAVLVRRSSAPEPVEVREAIGWLDQAVTLDPAFAHAYALRAEMHDGLHWDGEDPSDERRKLVGDSVEMALKLDPDLPEAYVAKAMHLYHGSRSYEPALRELETARKLAPGNASIHFWLAMIQRRQSQWDEAISSLERATALDPLNPNFLEEYAGTLRMLRRYADAEPVYERVLRLDPQSAGARLDVAYNRFLRNGDLAPLKRVLAEIPAGHNPGCGISNMRAYVATLERRLDDAVAAAEACNQPYVGFGAGQQVPRELVVAFYRWLATRRLPAEAAKARALLEGMLAERPDQATVRLCLALTLVMSGERERALQEVERALASMPVSRDALTGAGTLQLAAGVHAHAGAEERAVTALEQLMQLPGGAHVQELKVDPFFDPLRSNPRFQKLLAEHSPDTAGR